MKYNALSRITSLSEVKEFASYLIKDLQVNFNPDTPFEEYTNLTTGEATFTEAECREGNRLLDECFAVCEKEGADIYEVTDLF